MLSSLASAQERLKQAEAKLAELSHFSASQHLAEAQKRWAARFATLDLALPRRPSMFSRARTVEAYRLRLAEAWKQAQASLGQFERQLQTSVPSLEKCQLSAETFKAELLTRYYAHILSYQAELGKQGKRQIPVEWMQMAAAAALFSVLYTALMLWVIQRPAKPTFTRGRRSAVIHHSFVRGPLFCLAAPRALSLPLLC